VAIVHDPASLLALTGVTDLLHIAGTGSRSPASAWIGLVLKPAVSGPFVTVTTPSTNCQPSLP